MTKRSWIYVGLVGALTLPVILVVKSRQTQPRLVSWRFPQGGYYPMMTIAFAPDGRLLSAHSDEQLRKWDVATGSLEKSVALSPFSRMSSFSLLPTFSRDGKWGVNQHIENGDRFLVWDLQTGQNAAPETSRVRARNDCIDFSADGTLLAVGGEHGASMRDRTYKKLPPNTPRGYVEVWDWRNDKWVWGKNLKLPVTGVSWANNGDLAIVGGSFVSNGIIGGPNSITYDRGGELTIWNPKRNRRLLQRVLRSRANGVAFSPDAKWVAVSETFVGARIWNARTGALHQMLKAPVPGRHGGSFLGSPRLEKLVISGDSRFVAGSSEKGRYGVKVWKVADGSFVGSYNTTAWHGSQSGPTDDAFALSPDGRFLAVGSSNTHQIVVYPLSSK